MSYNAKYNTRNSRYNTPGQFVPAGAGELIPGANPPPPRTQQRPPLPAAAPGYGNSTASPQSGLFSQGPRNQNLQLIQTQDVEMKPEVMDTSASDANGDAAPRPAWMKSKLLGVKKVSNKERRRRQNETLRRLLTPKNALMVLNEMMPNDQVANQFKVEAAGAQYSQQFQYYGKVSGQHSFCADLTLDGTTYKGYGENKLTARNAAAEQAIRDLIIKKMGKVMSADALAAAAAATAAAAGGAGPAPPAEAGAAPAADGEPAPEEALPMIQLASFALHKLFSEWEYEGHKVPQLKPHPHSMSESASDAAAAAVPSAPRAPAAAKKPRALPDNAPTMHPCMLLTVMRPATEYRELAVEGDRPQNMIFTLGVDVDGATYIGKASNKKEARKAAARAACTALFGVQFVEPPKPEPASAGN